MTKISTYNIDDNVTANDKWIGSDVNNFNKTKNFTPKKLAVYFNGSQVINTGMELLYKYFTVAPSETRPAGTISFENEIGPVVSFSSITTFLISKSTQKGNNVDEFLGFLVGTKSLLYKADDVNVFGYYDIVSIEPYIGDNNFYVVTLSFIEGNGSIEEDMDYMISMIDVNTAEAQDLQSVTDIGSITTNTITAEAFIKHDGDGTNLLLDNGTTIPLNDVDNQSLQDVTDVGNTTDHTIIIDSTNYYSSLGPDAVGTENKDTGTYTYIGADGVLGIKNETVESQLKNTDVTSSSVILEFPDKESGSYTIATTDDVPATPGLQQVTDEGSTTTTSITATSFIKQDGTGDNILLDNGTTIPLTSVGNQNLESVLDNGNTAAIGISLYLETADTGLSSTSLDGIGIAGSSDTSIGIQASSNNKALEVLLNDNTVTGVDISSTTGATGTPLKVTKNSVTKLSINQEGELTADKLIKDGGTLSEFLMADGSVTIGNGGVYSYEIHVSQVDGNDTTGTGAVLNPVASITKALTLITGQRRTIIIHPGNYTESPSITAQFTVLTTYQATGGNTLITGTVSTSTGCSVSGLKMTNLTINAPTGTGNVNILNCDIAGTLTRTNTGTYTLIRFCDIGVTNINSTSGTVAIFGGNPSFITVNNAGASVLVKNAVCISPVVLVGNTTFADCILISTGPTTNALTSSAGTFITLANSQCVIPTFQNVSRVSLSGFYSILNCVYDKPNSTLVATSGTGGTTNSIGYSQYINADKFIKQGGTGTNVLLDNGNTIAVSTIDGTVTSVGVSMPSAFTVTNSPVNTSGTIAVTGAGLASQYIRGDGQLASFPDIAGGGGGQVYYCNGGTSQGTIGGSTFYQISTGAILSAGVDFTSGTVNNVAFANFITDIGKPTQEVVPAGVWIFQCYLSASSTNNLEVYATVEVYNGSTFNVLATSLVEVLTRGTSIDLYTFTCAVPEFDPIIPDDRIAIRFYPSNLSGGKTITLHTQDSHLSSIQTTFTTGLASLNGLTSASQLFATGTSGNDFNVNSTSATHTFNIPDASSVSGRRGLLISADWTTFNNKQNALGFTPYNATNPSNFISLTALSSSATGLTYTNTTGVFSLTSGYSIPTNTSQTSWDTAYTSRISTFSVTGSSGAATFSGNTLNIPTYTIAGLGGAGLALANEFTNLNTFTNIQDDDAVVTISNSLSGGGLSISAGTGISAYIAYGTASTSTGIKLYGNSTQNGVPLVIYDGSGLKAQISSSGVILGSQLIVSGGLTTGFLKANGDIDSNTYSPSPTTITSLTTNLISGSTHTHAITPSLGFIGVGTAQWQVPVTTNPTTYTTSWISAPNLYSSAGLNSLSFASQTGFVKMTAANTFALDPITNYATIASPTFTGTPAAPTAAVGTNTTQLATTAFVKTAVDAVAASSVSNITITTSVSIDTTTLGTSGAVSTYTQNGRNVMVNNSTAINITCAAGAATDFIASYTKLSVSGLNITFSGVLGNLTVLGGSVGVLSGAAGSTALLTRNGTGQYYLQISNL